MDSVVPEAAVSRPRVVLGVSGGIAAYKACELLRLFTESGHDVTVVPTAAALEFVGAPTWAALSGQAGQHRGLGERARGAARADRPGGRARRGGPGDRRPDGPGRARPGRRPAHQHAAHRPLPGRVRPGDAHRDVGAPGHPGQRGHAALARCRRDRARRGPADRCRHRQGTAARPGRDLRARRRPARPGRPARRRPGPGPRRQAGGGLGRRHPRVPRPGAVPRQPLVRPDGLRPGPYGGRPRRRGHPRRRQREPARPRRREGRHGGDHRPAPGARRRGVRSPPTPW